MTGNNDKSNDDRLKLSGRVSPLERNYLFSSLLVNRTMAVKASLLLTPDVLSYESEPHLVVVWRAACDLISSSWPSEPQQARMALECKCDSIIESAKMYAPYYEQVMQVIESAYSGMGVLSPDNLSLLLRRFMRERLSFDSLRSLIKDVPAGQTVESVAGMMEDVRTIDSYIDRIGNTDTQSTSVFPSSWEKGMKLETVSSGMAYVDKLTEGGPSLKEVIVVLGTTGGGKTVTAITAAVAGAKTQYGNKLSGLPYKHWYYLCYEEPINPFLRRRVISCAAELSFSKTLSKMNSLSDLSTSACLKDYEKYRWSNEILEGRPVLGETERLDIAKEYVGETLHLKDMSGIDNYTEGAGGIDEISSYLSSEIDQGRHPVGVVIDYAGLAVKRYISHRRLPPDAEYLLLDGFVNEVRVKIANRYDCICWVLHQLHGDSGRSSSSKRQHHSGARGAHNFGDNANFIFSLGTIDPATKCLRFSMTKHRRVPPAESDPVVMIDGDFNLASDASARYVVDRQSGCIVSRSDAALFGAVDHNVVDKLSNRGSIDGNSLKLAFVPSEPETEPEQDAEFTNNEDQDMTNVHRPDSNNLGTAPFDLGADVD